VLSAGVGKTVIAYCCHIGALADFCRSLANNCLETRYLYDENIGLACVYFDHKQEFRTIDILGSILKQIVQRRAVVSDEIHEIYRIRYEKRGTRPTLKDVSTALQVEISRFTKVFLVLDALDECPTREYTSDRILAELKKLLPGIRLMITGRPFVVSYISQLGGFQTLEIRALCRVARTRKVNKTKVTFASGNLGGLNTQCPLVRAMISSFLMACFMWAPCHVANRRTIALCAHHVMTHVLALLTVMWKRTYVVNST